MVVGIFSALFFYNIFNVFRDSPDLWLIASLAYNKEISYSFIDFAEIKRNDVFSFFILDSGNDRFDDL